MGSNLHLIYSGLYFINLDLHFVGLDLPFIGFGGYAIWVASRTSTTWRRISREEMCLKAAFTCASEYTRCQTNPPIPIGATV